MSQKVNIEVVKNVEEVSISVNETNENVSLNISQKLEIVNIEVTDNVTVLLPAEVENRIQILENLFPSLNNAESYNLVLSVDLLDNIEREYTISVTDLTLAKNYFLIYNSQHEGISAILKSWKDDSIKMIIKNNSGIAFSDSLSFIIKESI